MKTTYKYGTTEHVFTKDNGYEGCFNSGRKISHRLEANGCKIVPWMQPTKEVDELFERLGFEKVVTKD